MRALLAVVLLVIALPLAAQTPLPTPQYAPAPRSGAARLSGPRAGVTLLSPGIVEKINDHYREIGVSEGEDVIDPTMPVVTQFGWQFETRLFQTPGGLTGVTELVPLIGGLDRGILLPSATFLVGVRTFEGIEFGVGPNLSATGVGYALAAGVNVRAGEVNLPVNVAAALGRGGPRVSLLVGMTFTDRRY